MATVTKMLFNERTIHLYSIIVSRAQSIYKFISYHVNCWSKTAKVVKNDLKTRFGHSLVPSAKSSNFSTVEITIHSLRLKA